MIQPSGPMVAAARKLLGLSQQELGDACGVSANIVNRFEVAASRPHGKNLEKMVAELEKRGIEFTNGTGLGVRLVFEKAAKYAAQQRAEQNAQRRNSPDALGSKP